MKYVVLLRGVNVGGNRRVPKAEFQAVLESLGCSDVQVYINSGNAVLNSKSALSSELVKVALKKHFKFDISTLVLMGEKVKSIATAIPIDWTNDPLKPDKSGQKSDVLYLFDEANTPDILDKLGYQSAIETFIYVDGAVLANISRANQPRGSLQKIIGTKLYNQITIRNIKTARRLAELVDTL